jgi:hypothetical protein
MPIHCVATQRVGRYITRGRLSGVSSLNLGRAERGPFFLSAQNGSTQGRSSISQVQALRCWR